MNMDALQEVLLAITQQRSVASVLQRIVEEVARQTGGGTSATKDADIALVRIWLVEAGDLCKSCHFRGECPDQTRCLHLSASAGRSRVGVESWSELGGLFRRFPIGVRKIGNIAARGLPLLIPDISADPTWVAQPAWAHAEGITTFAGHPLVFRGETLGVLGVFSRTPFRAGDFERLQSFANHAAVAIANARAFEEIEALRARLEDENRYLREEVVATIGAGNIIGESPSLRSVMQQVQLVAPTDATVLITGESGVGKELVARAIHDHSGRSDRALIKVNCGAVPEGLFEAEFFGHARGAFTGAHKDRPGRFELADGGTLFLDEIGEVPLSMQAKLLRVLQEGELERVGDARTRKVDVRVIAATHRDLAHETKLGRFRQDLFYRLNVFPLRVPPLRERRDDIGPLALHFAAESARRMNRPVPKIPEETLALLAAYDWPGNVRELHNAVERAVILAQGRPLHFDLGESVGSASMPSSPKAPPPAASTPTPRTRSEWKRQEKEIISAALRQTDGKLFGAGGAAELLSMKPTTLASRVRALGIERKTRQAK